MFEVGGVEGLSGVLAGSSVFVISGFISSESVFVGSDVSVIGLTMLGVSGMCMAGFGAGTTGFTSGL